MSTKPIKFTWCKCSWESCGKMHEDIAKNCFLNDKNDEQLGYLRITKKQVQLQEIVRKHLGNGWETSDMYVARLHYPRGLMAAHGNKAHQLCFNGEVKTVGRLQHTNRWKKIDKILSPQEANRFGIQDESEKAKDKDGKKVNGFIFAPINTRDNVRRLVATFTIPESRSRSLRLQTRKGPPSKEANEEQNQSDLPLKMPLFVPRRATTPAADQMQQSDEECKFDRSDPGTFTVPISTLASVIKVEAKKHCKVEDNFVTLDHMQQNLDVLRSALFLYTQYHQCFDSIEVDRPQTSTGQHDDSSKPFFLRPCKCPLVDGCTSFQILQANKGHQTGLCKVCAREHKNQKVRTLPARRGTEIVPSKFTNNKYLTKDELAGKVKSLAVQKKVTNRAISRARQQLQRSKDKYSMRLASGDRELRSLFEKASAHVQKHKTTATKALMDAVMEQMVLADKATKDGNGDTLENRRAKAKVLVDDIVDSITNWSTKVNSGARSVRYSPRIMRIALSLFMADRKGYKQWKASKIEPWP